MVTPQKNFFGQNPTKFLNLMVAPNKIFWAKTFLGVVGLQKFWGVSLENHFVDSFTSPDKPQ